MLDLRTDSASAPPAEDAYDKPRMFPLAAWQSAGRTLIPGKPIPPSDAPDYTIQRDDLTELYAARLIARLTALNGLVRETGERLEGGIFYWHGDSAFYDNAPAADLAPA